jgi:hypothetical protein
VSRDTDGEALVRAMRDAIQRVRDHDFPRLLVVTVEDGEELRWDDGELRCPVCDMRVYGETLAAVTVDEHWCYNYDTDVKSFASKRVTFDSDTDRDLGETLYYLHNDHGVSLPDGWTEDWW